MRIDYLVDVPDLGLSLVPAIAEAWRHVSPPELTLERRAEKLRRHTNRDELPIAWIAHEDGIALGTAALRATDLEGRDDLAPWLAGVFVRAEFRRRGIASALCETVQRKARELGFYRLYLFTTDQQSLYARLGWVTIEHATWRQRPIEIMVKQL